MPAASAIFDPYEDRTARDVRNRLSVAFVKAVRCGAFEGLLSAVERICPPGTGRVYCAFANNRMNQYRHAFETIRAAGTADPIFQAVVLWNEGLFFEVHEILESIWNDAQQWRKEALRGWIQAAGVYVHRQRGANRAAETLAARAAAHLKAHRRELSEIGNIEELVEALTDPDRPAPVLEFMGPMVK
ncbi:MAG: DUF309 domain-containing protein [Desulfobacterales bacterium]|nr:DUF309 domain-containing protein [Desulfobacterales bacterium]